MKTGVGGNLVGTVAEWAEQTGITRANAFRRVKLARIPRFADNTIDFATADRVWASFTRGKGGKRVKGRTEDELIKQIGRIERTAGKIESIGATSTDAMGVPADVGSMADDLADDLMGFQAGLQAEAGPSNGKNGHTGRLTGIDGGEGSPGPSLGGFGDLNELSAHSLKEAAEKEGIPGIRGVDYAIKMVQLQENITDLRKTIQNLVPLNIVRDFEARVLTDLRGALIPIGGELRDDLASCSDPVRCQELVDDRIYGALKQVAQFTPGMKDG